MKNFNISLKRDRFTVLVGIVILVLCSTEVVAKEVFFRVAAVTGPHNNEKSKKIMNEGIASCKNDACVLNALRSAIPVGQAELGTIRIYYSDGQKKYFNNYKILRNSIVSVELDETIYTQVRTKPLIAQQQRWENHRLDCWAEMGTAEHSILITVSQETGQENSTGSGRYLQTEKLNFSSTIFYDSVFSETEFQLNVSTTISAKKGSSCFKLKIRNNSPGCHKEQIKMNVPKPVER